MNYLTTWYRNRQESGDTIVEVLIAMAVIALILGGAYATANSSLLGTRESQERGEALKLAEGQLEAIRGAATAASATTSIASIPVFNASDIFCIPIDSTTGNPVTAVTHTSHAPYLIGQMPSINAELAGDAIYTPDNGPTNPGCAVQPQNGVTYDIGVDFCGPNTLPWTNPDVQPTGESGCPPEGNPTLGYLYTVHVRWGALTGDNIDEATLTYRIYPPGITPTSGGVGGPTNGDANADVSLCGLANGCGATATNHPGQPVTFYAVTLTNNSYNPGLTVTGCTWVWGDGSSTTWPTTPATPESDGACDFGQNIYHCYGPPYVSGEYQVKLIEEFSNGATAHTTYPSSGFIDEPSSTDTTYYDSPGCSTPG